MCREYNGETTPHNCGLRIIAADGHAAKGIFGGVVIDVQAVSAAAKGGAIFAGPGEPRCDELIAA